jgi:hypothetical protein
MQQPCQVASAGLSVLNKSQVKQGQSLLLDLMLTTPPTNFMSRDLEVGSCSAGMKPSAKQDTQHTAARLKQSAAAARPSQRLCYHTNVKVQPQTKATGPHIVDTSCTGVLCQCTDVL